MSKFKSSPIGHACGPYYSKTYGEKISLILNAHCTLLPHSMRVPYLLRARSMHAQCKKILTKKHLLNIRTKGVMPVTPPVLMFHRCVSFCFLHAFLKKKICIVFCNFWHFCMLLHDLSVFCTYFVC